MGTYWNPAQKPAAPRTKPQSKRARHVGVRVFLALALGSLMLPQLISPADAVHDVGVFELEGDADSSAAPGDDWDVVCDEASTGEGCDGEGSTSGATAVSFLSEGTGESIFTGGGSKDFEDTTEWKWKDGSVPDKDELLHGFAARYEQDIDSGQTGGDAGPETLLYFGADRFDNSGDAQIGFWFLQGAVAPTGTSKGGGSPFGPDAHVVGDILVLSDFTNGGTVPTISVFEWVGTGGNAPNTGGTLDVLTTNLTPSLCGAAAGDDFCAITNSGTKNAPWNFTNKSGESDFAQGELYEGGINLSSFPGLEGECFASFMVETRSSQSITAVLKDFIAGEFEECEATINTTPSSTSIQLGSSITDNAVVTGQAGGGTPTGHMEFYVCGPNTASPPVDPNCSTGGTALDGTADGGTTPTQVPLVAVAGSDPPASTATSPSFTPSAVGRYCFRGEYHPDAASLYAPVSDFDSSECFTVFDTTSVSTAQEWRPNDSATITAQGGSALSGNVVFTLYNNGTCTAGASDVNVLYTETRPVSGASPQTVSTTNDGSVASDPEFTDTTAGPTGTTHTLSWRAVYTGSPANQTGPCETSTVTITD